MRRILWFLLMLALGGPAYASCSGNAGVPFNCTVGNTPQSADLVLGGSNTAPQAGKTVSWTLGQIFASTPPIGATTPNSGSFTNLTLSSTFKNGSAIITLPTAASTLLYASGGITSGDCAIASGTAGNMTFGSCGGSSGIIAPANGGTGVNNGTNTLTLGGITAFSGANSVQFTSTGTTALTLPTSGTLVSSSSLAAAMGTAFGNTQGTVLFNNGTTWTVLSPGTSGYFLETLGIGANPAWAAAAGGSGCTVSGGAQYQIIVNNGSSGCSSSVDGTVNLGALTLGASGTLGKVTMGNATSGTVTLSPTTGALGTVTATLPANTGTLAELNLAQTWSATQTFGALSATGAVSFTGSVSGSGMGTYLGTSGAGTLTQPIGGGIYYDSGMVVYNTTEDIGPPWPYNSGTISKVTYYTSGLSPSFTISWQINGTPIAGCTGLAVTSSTLSTATCTSANTISTGQQLSVVITGASGTPQLAQLAFAGVRSNY